MVARSCEVCGSLGFMKLFEKAGHTFVRCDSCGLERLDPQPTDETLSKIYGEHYYDAWGLHGNEDVVGRLKRKTFEYVIGKLPERGAEKGRLLDLGAATGFLLDVAAQRGYEPFGVELSEFGAKEIARKFGADHVFCGQLEDATFPQVTPLTFETVTMCDYIEHVRAPRETLARVRSMLTSNGALAITSPDTGSLSRRLLGNGWSHYKVEHLYYFNRRNLDRLLKDVGFRRVTFHPLVKTLSLDYVHRQLGVYPHRALTPVSNALNAVLPSPLRAAPLKFFAGELLAVAEV